MIRRIEHIKRMGVFGSFQWDASLPDFNHLNLLYGWNFSGKTTLSRLFRSLEKKQLPPQFADATFSIASTAGSVITQEGLNAAEPVAVFNSDFVQENLLFDEARTQPILVLGEADLKREAELEALREQLQTRNAELQNLDARWKETKLRIEDARTARARHVKNVLLIPNYDKGKLLVQMSGCQPQPQHHLLSSGELERLLKTYLSGEEKEVLVYPVPNVQNFDSLWNQVRDISSSIPTAKIIEELARDSALQTWVETGLSLHEGHQHCRFCGSEIDARMMKRLQAHFSREFSNLMNKITDMEALLSGEIEFTPITFEPAQLYPNEREDFGALLKEIKELTQHRRDALIALRDVLHKKKTVLFETPEMPELSVADAKGLECVDRLKELVETHNKRTRAFAANRLSDRARLEKHFAAELLLDETYQKDVNAEADLAQKIDALKKAQEESALKVAHMEEELLDSAKGAGKLTQLIQTMLGSDSLSIQSGMDGRFTILRNNELARHLSDGERTAIAFAYFLTDVLRDPDRLPNLTIFVDDPVSSLDSHHLFNTVALLRTTLSSCQQLFISTHNFEFYSLVREWFHELERLDGKKKHASLQKWRAYVIERDGPFSSRIRETPDELLLFRSEYHYLFAILYDFSQKPSPSFVQAHALPNIARRFMETFAGIMEPTHEGLRKKLDRLVKDPVERERVWKFLNRYSHGTGATHAINHPDYAEAQFVIRACIQAVHERDERHYEGLLVATSNGPSQSLPPRIPSP